MVNIIEKNGFYILKIIIREIHTLDVPDLKEKIQQIILVNNIKKLILDLSDVRTITSSGIGIFLSIHKSLDSNLRLARPSAEVKKVLELTKVGSIIKVYDDLDEAEKSF